MTTLVRNDVLERLVQEIVALRREVNEVKDRLMALENTEPEVNLDNLTLDPEEEEDDFMLPGNHRARTWAEITKYGHREESCFGGYKCTSYSIGMPNEKTFYGRRPNGEVRGFNKLKLVARWVYGERL